MKKLLHTSRPMWAGENADVVETAMIEVEVAGAEYREGPEGRSQGLKVGGADGPKNNPDGAEKVAGAEDKYGRR